MKYHWVSAVLILAAYLLFLSGISLIGRSSVGALLVIAAGACEFRFWWRFFHRPAVLRRGSWFAHDPSGTFENRCRPHYDPFQPLVTVRFAALKIALCAG